jgi:hypothetical protein
MQFFLKNMPLLGSVLLLGACGSTYQPVPEHKTIQVNSAIAVTAGISQTFIRDKNANYLICTQSMPDAAYDQGDDANISYALIDTSSDQISGQDDSNEVEMAGRTPTVLMAREMFFRACEFSVNYDLNKQEALTLYNQTLQTIGKVWATEAQNTTVTIGDSVKDSTLLTVSDKGTQMVSSANSPQLLQSSQQTTSDSDDDSDSSSDSDY